MSTICRACLQTVDRNTFFYIDTFDNTQIANTIPKDVLLLCVPEMDLYVSEQPGVCGDCLTMFEAFYNFKNKCLASEDRVLSYSKRYKLQPQCKVNLACVVYEAGEHPPPPPPVPLEEPENCRALAQLEGNGEVDLIRLKAASISGPHCELPRPPEAADKDVVLLSCNECSFVTMDRDKLSAHKCLSVSSEKYKCPYCDYATGRRYRLSYHINSKHTKTTWYECAQCDYKTTDASSLKRHRKVVHFVVEDGAQVFSCELCEFKTLSEVAFQRHRGAKHGPIVQVCAICNYQTKDKSNFRKHTYIHGDKPRKCTKCSYQCVSPYQLEKHYKRTHV